MSRAENDRAVDARGVGFRYGQRVALESVGFDVTLDDFVRNLPGDFARRHGLFETEDIYIARKPVEMKQTSDPQQ